MYFKKNIKLKLFNINFLLKLVLILFFTNNVYAKPFKIKIISESKDGGIYSYNMPKIYAKKGRFIETFNKINNLSQKNCLNYSKESFFFTKYIEKKNSTTSSFFIEDGGNIKERGGDPDIGYIPDHSYDVKLFWPHFRFYCGANIEEVLIKHSLRNKIFPQKMFFVSQDNLAFTVGDNNNEYFTTSNNIFSLKKVSQKNRDNIKLALKEINQDRSSSIKDKRGFTKSNLAYANYGDVISQSKKNCEEIGFKINTNKFTNCVLELTKISDNFEMAKYQESLLKERAIKKENLDIKFTYQDKSGSQINKESKWTSFWKEVAWIFYEYGDDILKVALDVKHGTNLSGYNTNSQQVSNNKLRCVNQRIGNVVHQHCNGNNSRVYCSYQQIGNVVHRNCRTK